MRGKRFKEEQIIRILKEAEKGVNVKDLCRQYGFCEQTFYMGVEGQSSAFIV